MTDSPAADQFVHLHVHSTYSLLDGACRISDMVSRAKELNQKALAITDHGCLFGVVDFYNKARSAGVKPIIGIEAYMAPGKRHDKTATGSKDGGYHLLLLAQNHVGYQNILKLSSIAYREGFYYKPRIDKEVLQAHSAGLICTSACLGGEIPTALMADNRKKAKEIADTYLSIFGPDRFFIEVQKHIQEQDQVNPALYDIASEKGIGTVATNDVHFLLEEDHHPHDALCCISTGKLVSEESRMKYPEQLFLKSAQQMYAASDDPKWRQACANTLTIANQCELELDFSANHAPVVKIEEISRAGVQAPGAPERSGESEGSSIDFQSMAGGTPAPLENKTVFAEDPAKGSTEWFKQYCSQFALLPFDATKEKLSQDELKAQCDSALRKLAQAGLIWRYGQEAITDEHRARLDRELKILADKSISAYFLIVWDFVNEARRRNIPSNARGSGVGTMVGYCLGLSNACPIKYGLLFERFTDPDRSEYPDIDIDICQDGRQEILEYVREKYGHVAQIITFGTLKARAAVRDVGRVLNIPLPEVDKVCKLIGDGLGITLDKALKQEADLKRLYDTSAEHKEMIDTARRLEGLARHAGVHAAGVVVATQPLDNLVPLYQPSGTDQVVTQWDGPTVEKMGLLKMDFLGLRTLSIIERARQLIKQTLDEKTIRKTVGEAAPKPAIGQRPMSESRLRRESGGTPALPDFEPLDLERLTYDDKKVLSLFSRGETAGVFQFESGGMRNLLMAMKPDRLEDLIAANALYRPGPMELIPNYNNRKHGREKVPKVNEIVDRLTSETYGIMVYQEQVMQVVNQLGGIPLRQAYTLIKAISKKKSKVINSNRAQFIQGAGTQGVSKKDAEELFDLILKFAGYGFNKSHSTGYAIIAYQTAYLKTYFPIQYMAAVLTYESVNTDKVVEYINECKHILLPGGVSNSRLRPEAGETPAPPEIAPPDSALPKRGVEVKPPDINLSDIGFTVVFNEGEPRDASHGHIRFGLSAIKGVGEKAVQNILDAREKKGPFTSIYDLTERVEPGQVNRSVLEALIKCGAFDAVHGIENRAALLQAVDGALQSGQRAASERNSGQMNFLGAILEEDDHSAAGGQIRLPDTQPWTNKQLLKNEKDVLGFYVSSHPLDQYQDDLNRFSSATIEQTGNLAAGAQVTIGGMLTRVRPTLVKKGKSAGQKMAMITLDDGNQHIDGVIFSDTYAETYSLLEEDRVVFLEGKIDRRREEPSIVVNKVVPIERDSELLSESLKIVVGDHDNERINDQIDQHVQNHSALWNELKKTLGHSAARANGNAVGVVLEINENNTTVQMRLNAKTATDRNLVEDLQQILLKLPGEKNRYEFIGPRKINSGQPPAGKSKNNSAQPIAALPFTSRLSAGEVCESVDRY